MAWSWSISWNCILPDFQTKRINITLPERVLAVVNEQARREGELRSDLLARAVLEYIGRHGVA